MLLQLPQQTLNLAAIAAIEWGWFEWKEGSAAYIAAEPEKVPQTKVHLQGGTVIELDKEDTAILVEAVKNLVTLDQTIQALAEGEQRLTEWEAELQAREAKLKGKK
jgi:hypothetical protein